MLNGTLNFALDSSGRTNGASGWASIVRRPANEAARPATEPGGKLGGSGGVTPPSPTSGARRTASAGVGFLGRRRATALPGGAARAARAARDFSADKLRERSPSSA